MTFDLTKKSDTIFSDDCFCEDVSDLEQMLEDAAQAINNANMSNVEKFYISVSIEAQYNEVDDFKR